MDIKEAEEAHMRCHIIFQNYKIGHLCNKQNSNMRYIFNRHHRTASSQAFKQHSLPRKGTEWKKSQGHKHYYYMKLLFK